MKPVFHACLRLEDNKLVLEYPATNPMGKHTKVTMDDLFVIGGDRKEILYMNDTPDTAAASLVSATARLGILFDPTTRNLYYDVTDVETNLKPEKSSIILTNANTGGELYIICDECVKEVA